MVHVRYSRWDGNLRDALDSESVFDQLSDYMNETGDLQQAMRRLMQKGVKQGEKQTKGIDDLLSQVAREMRKMYDEYRLQSAMDEVQQQLDSILDQERHTLDDLDQTGQDVQAKQQFLNDLPGKVSEAVEKLTSYRFENSNNCSCSWTRSASWKIGCDGREVCFAARLRCNSKSRRS